MSQRPQCTCKIPDSICRVHYECAPFESNPIRVADEVFITKLQKENLELRIAIEEAREIIENSECAHGFDEIRTEWLTKHSNLFKGSVDE